MTSAIPTARSVATPAATLPVGSAAVGHGKPPPPHRTLPSGVLGRVGAWCYDHRKAAVGIWFAALIVILAGAAGLGAAYDASPDVPASESADGFDALERYFPSLGAGGGSGTIVFRADQGVDDPAVTAAELGVLQPVVAEDELADPLRHQGRAHGPHSGRRCRRVR